MRVTLLLDNPGGVRSGCLNLDPFCEDSDPHRLKGDVGDLSAFVEEGQATEILALDVLDKFPSQHSSAVLDQWASRLRHKGRLTISVVDAQEVTRLYQQGHLSEEELSLLLYERQDHPARMKRSIFSSNQLVEMLQGRGLKIVYAAFDHVRFVVTAERL